MAPALVEEANANLIPSEVTVNPLDDSSFIFTVADPSSLMKIPSPCFIPPIVVGVAIGIEATPVAVNSPVSSFSSSPVPIDFMLGRPFSLFISSLDTSNNKLADSAAVFHIFFSFSDT